MAAAARPLTGQVAPQRGLDRRDLHPVSTADAARLGQMIDAGPAVKPQEPDGAATYFLLAQEVGAFECPQDDPIGLLKLRRGQQPLLRGEGLVEPMPVPGGLPSLDVVEVGGQGFER